MMLIFAKLKEFSIILKDSYSMEKKLILERYIITKCRKKRADITDYPGAKSMKF